MLKGWCVSGGGVGVEVGPATIINHFWEYFFSSISFHLIVTQLLIGQSEIILLSNDLANQKLCNFQMV